MTSDRIAAQFSTTVAEVASATLSQVSGKTWSCEVSAADNPTVGGIAVCFQAAEGLDGGFSLDLPKRTALELARIFVGDVPPPPEITEPAEEDCEAVDELMRTIGGAAATALRAHFGKIELKFAGRMAPEWKPAQSWLLALTQDATTIELTLVFSDEILKPKQEEKAAAATDTSAQSTPQPSTAVVAKSNPDPSKTVAPPPTSSASPSSGSKGSTAVPVNRHTSNDSARKIQELMRDKNLDLLLDIELPVTLRFGRREMLIKDILELSSGSVIELDRQVAEPVDLLVDRKIIARGEVVIVDGNYGLRVTEVATPQQRIECLF